METIQEIIKEVREQFDEHEYAESVVRRAFEVGKHALVKEILAYLNAEARDGLRGDDFAKSAVKYLTNMAVDLEEESNTP